jgi:hypothetical protein
MIPEKQRLHREQQESVSAKRNLDLTFVNGAVRATKGNPWLSDIPSTGKLFVRRLPGRNAKIGSGELEVGVTYCRRLTGVNSVNYETSVNAFPEIRFFLRGLGRRGFLGFHDSLRIC